MAITQLFKRWKERRAEKQKLQATRDLATQWRLLEKMFLTGMLSYDEKTRRLYVSQSMATLMLSGGVDAWVNSVHNIYLYTYWRQSQARWEKYLKDEELKAVRKAVKEAAPERLSDDDIRRIRQSRRWDVSVGELPPMKAEAFEFFIIPDSVEAHPEPIAVGYYNPENGDMDVANWKDVKVWLTGDDEKEK